MRVRPFVAALCLLAACGAPSYPVTLTASPAAAPAAAIECAKQKLGPLGYRATAYDDQELRLQARKPDLKVTRANPQFRRNIDELDITGAPGADGKTTLTVVGHTYAELETHRGPTEEEEPASAGVKESVQAILDACGKP
jgi:hypothetical protein